METKPPIKINPLQVIKELLFLVILFFGVKACWNAANKSESASEENLDYQNQSYQEKATPEEINEVRQYQRNLQNWYDNTTYEEREKERKEFHQKIFPNTKYTPTEEEPKRTLHTYPADTTTDEERDDALRNLQNQIRESELQSNEQDTSSR